MIELKIRKRSDVKSMKRLKRLFNLLTEPFIFASFKGYAYNVLYLIFTIIQIAIIIAYTIFGFNSISFVPFILSVFIPNEIQTIYFSRKHQDKTDFLKKESGVPF